VALAGPLTRAAAPVTNGLFTVSLDFGDVFDGSARYLQELKQRLERLEALLAQRQANVE
jgi:hypothetical protein